MSVGGCSCSAAPASKLYAAENARLKAGFYLSRKCELYNARTMPEFSIEFWVATGIAAFALLVGLAVTLAMDAKTRGEFRVAASCFFLNRFHYSIWNWSP